MRKFSQNLRYNNWIYKKREFLQIYTRVPNDSPIKSFNLVTFFRDNLIPVQTGDI